MGKKAMLSNLHQYSILYYVPFSLHLFLEN